MELLARLRAELARYEHPLFAFDARSNEAGAVELVISLKTPVADAEPYVAEVHARDIAHPQFTWNFQRFLYDCLHDYVAELFTRNPQQREPAERRAE
jgi:hypothetical protein